MPKHGDVIGRFVLERELGRGPMSEVFLAVEKASGWKVACKVFLLEPRSKPGDHERWSQRMVREATAASQFQHELAVRVHEVGMLQGVPYLVRDFIEGRSLAEHVADQSGQAQVKGVPERKLGWLRDLARVLAEIHRASLVHRDVKPSNVLIRRDGALRLLDFGVARRSVDRDAGLIGAVDRLPSGTERLRVLGTPAYMAPERLAHQGTSAAADQFGWGVLAYELLAGVLPWGAAEGKRLRPIRIIEAILTQVPPPLRTFAPKTTPAVEAIVTRAMAKDPAARFPSMDYLHQAIAQAIDEAVR